MCPLPAPIHRQLLPRTFQRTAAALLFGLPHCSIPLTLPPPLSLASRFILYIGCWVAFHCLMVSSVFVPRFRCEDEVGAAGRVFFSQSWFSRSPCVHARVMCGLAPSGSPKQQNEGRAVGGPGGTDFAAARTVRLVFSRLCSILAHGFWRRRRSFRAVSETSKGGVARPRRGRCPAPAPPFFNPAR